MRVRSSANCRAASIMAALGLALLQTVPAGAQGGTNPPVLPPTQPPRTAPVSPIQPLVVQGSHLRPCALNDNGQVLYLAASPAGGDDLWQYTASAAIPIAQVGTAGPAGEWKGISSGPGAPSMNQRGDVVFAADVSLGNTTFSGLFRWDSTTRTTTPLLMPGMPLGSSLIYSGERCQAAINNLGDVAFQVTVQDPKGIWGEGVFLLGRDGKLQPVALGHGSYGTNPPGGNQPQPLEFRNVSQPSLNDAGAVAFVGTARDVTAGSGYIWEQGSLTPAAAAGKALGGWLKLGDVSRVWVNNQNKSVLVRAGVAGIPGADALFRSINGDLTPLVVPGQIVPGLGSLAGIVAGSPGGVSPANDAAAHAFLANGGSDSMAACLLAADGTITSLLDTSAAAGERVGIALVRLAGGDGGIALNNRGQVAVTVESDSQEGIVLLTPQ